MCAFDIRELQLTELDILIEIDRICRTHRIRYFLCAGTLLGAVRHHGFIPWDDDIDLMMPLSDYKRFCRVSKKELKEPYFLQNHNTDKNHRWFCKVRKSGTTLLEKGFEDFPMHHGVWVDVFPIFGVKPDKDWLKKLNRIARFFRVLIKKKMEIASWKDRSVYSKALCFVPLFVIRAVVNAAYSLLFCDFEDYPKCDALCGNRTIRPKYDSDWFRESCELLFENRLFFAPKKWDEYLSSEYGDYMTPPPPEKRNGGLHEVVLVDLEHDYDEIRGMNG